MKIMKSNVKEGDKSQQWDSTGLENVQTSLIIIIILYKMF